MTGRSPEEFKKWYIDTNKSINKKEFSKNFGILIKSKKQKRAGKYYQAISRYADLENIKNAESIRRVLSDEVDLFHLDRETGLSFHEISKIPGLTKELRDVVRSIARRSVNRDKLEPIHIRNVELLRSICGEYEFYRRHSTIKGLIIDKLSFALNDNHEVTCNCQLVNVARGVDDYEGRALFDGRKITAILTKKEKADHYVDTVTIAILFSDTYSRHAAILSGTVDHNESAICAARAALVRSDGKNAQPRVVDGQLTPEQKHLYEKVNSVRLLHSDDHVLMFDNLWLNTER